MARKLTTDGRQALAMFPRSRGWGARHWLYVIGFVDGTTKLGITGSPRERFVQHWRKYGERMQWVHLAGSLRNARACWSAERMALELCERDAVRLGATEHFSGLTKEAAIGHVRAAIAAHA